MKPQVSKSFLLIIIALFAGSLSAQKKIEVKKTINKEYKVDQTKLLEIDNKFGDVKFTEWNENKVEIVVTVTVAEKDEEKAKKKLEDINVLFSESAATISAKTEIGKGKSGFFSVEGNKGGEMSIDYDIKLPVYLKLDVSNSYGDVLINEHHGKSDLKVKFGSLIAKNLAFDESQPLSKIRVSYGALDITKMTWANIKIDFSDLNIASFNGIELESKYTDVKIGAGNMLQGEIQFGDLNIAEVGVLNIKASYSDVKIEKLAKSLNLVCKFGDLKILSVNQNFEKIDVDGQYSDIKLVVKPSSSFTVVADVKYGDIKFPDDFKVSIAKDDFNEGVNTKIGNNPNAIIKIENSFGDVKFEY